MYYTILDINEYFVANNLEFSWDKSLEFINMKLQPYYEVHNGTYCPDIDKFKNCYDKEPIYVPIDNRPEVKSIRYIEQFRFNIFSYIRVMVHFNHTTVSNFDIRNIF